MTGPDVSGDYDTHVIHVRSTVGNVDVGLRLGPADACVQRCDHGQGRPLTLDEAVEAVTHPLAGLNRAKLVEAVAYLSCQVVGLQHRRSVSAELAIHQIEKILKDRLWADAAARGDT